LCCLQFAADWEVARADKEQGKILTLPVLRANSGGLIVKFNSLQGFVPNPLLSPAHWCKGTSFIFSNSCNPLQIL
jgi:ribosomal protein S1